MPRLIEIVVKELNKPLDIKQSFVFKSIIYQYFQLGIKCLTGESYECMKQNHKISKTQTNNFNCLKKILI